MKRLSEVLLAVVLLVSGSVAAIANEYDETVEKTKDDFKIVVDSVEEAKGKVEDLQSGLDDAREFLKENGDKIPPDQRKKLQDAIDQVSSGLKKPLEVMDKFGKYAKHATSVFDMYDDVKGVYEKTQLRRGGPLAKQLSLLAEGMTRYGGKVPVLGDFIEVYGKITTGVLDATDKLAADITEARDQGEIGGQGTYDKDNEQYKKLVDQFGAEFAKEHRWVPEFPLGYYRASDSQIVDVSLIWDAKSKEWYKVPASSPVSEIFRDNLLIGKRRSAWELKVLAEKYDNAKSRMATADQIQSSLAKWDRLFVGDMSDVLDKINERHGYGVTMKFRDAHEFRARYAYDAEFQQWVKSVLVEMRDELDAQDKDDSRKQLEKWAKNLGISMPALPDDDDPADPANPAAEIANSIIILIDASGSMGGDKISRAKATARRQVAKLTEDTEVSVMYFNGKGKVNVAADFTTMNAAGRSKVRTAIASIGAGGDTNLAEGIRRAGGKLRLKARGDRQLTLIVLSDGEETCGGDPAAEAGRLNDMSVRW